MRGRGEVVELQERPVRIDELTIERYEWPNLSLHIRCGRGTYVRSLARQIGEALGTGGYLTALRRTAVGIYTVDQAMGLDQVPDILSVDDLLPLPSEPVL